MGRRRPVFSFRLAGAEGHIQDEFFMLRGVVLIHLMAFRVVVINGVVTSILYDIHTSCCFSKYFHNIKSYGNLNLAVNSVGFESIKLSARHIIMSVIKCDVEGEKKQ